MAAIELSTKSHCQVETKEQAKDKERLTYQHLHIQITAPNGILTPADLKEMAIPTGLIWSHGVVIEGRAPVWLYGAIVHAYHPATWVACFDPRLGSGEVHTGGAVVVMSHTAKVAVGDVLIVRMPDEYLG